MGCTSEKMAMTTISDTDKQLVKESWNIFVSKGAFSDTGSDLFKNLLEEHPELKSLFSFMKVNDSPFDSPQYRNHVKNVFQVIGDAVNHIDDLENLQPVLKDLGYKHYAYGARNSYLKPVGNALLCTLEKQLDKNFTKDVFNAWRNFFAVLSGGFSQGLDEGSQNGK